MVPLLLITMQVGTDDALPILPNSVLCLLPYLLFLAGALLSFGTIVDFHNELLCQLLPIKRAPGPPYMFIGTRLVECCMALK